MWHKYGRQLPFNVLMRLNMHVPCGPGGVTCSSPSVSLHRNLLTSAAQLAMAVIPPASLIAAFRSPGPLQRAAPAGQVAKPRKGNLILKSISLDLSDAMIAMQTAYVVPQHVSEHYAKLLVGCQQQLQLQALHATCQPADGRLKASFSKLQLYSLQEQAQQLGGGVPLTTRRSDLMDVQIRELLTGLKPAGSMPARTSSGQQAMPAGIRKNQILSLGPFSVTGAAPGLALIQGQPLTAGPASNPDQLDAAIEHVGLQFEPDDAFAACAAFRDIKAASQLLQSSLHDADGRMASQGPVPGEAPHERSSPQPVRQAAKQKQVALLKRLQHATLHFSIGPLRAEAALAPGFHWQAEASLLEVQAGQGIQGSLSKGSIMLNEKPLVTCASATADLVHPIPMQPKKAGELFTVALISLGACRSLRMRKVSAGLLSQALNGKQSSKLVVKWQMKMNMNLADFDDHLLEQRVAQNYNHNGMSLNAWAVPCKESMTCMSIARTLVRLHCPAHLLTKLHRHTILSRCAFLNCTFIGVLHCCRHIGSCRAPALHDP